MSVIAKLAWPIQIAIFIMLLIFLPPGTSRLIMLFGYIFVSIFIVRYIRKTYA